MDASIDKSKNLKTPVDEVIKSFDEYISRHTRFNQSRSLNIDPNFQAQVENILNVSRSLQDSLNRV